MDIEDLLIGWPENRSSIIKVMGVGGGGGNAVNYMYQQGVHDVDFVVCNTDSQALKKSPVPVKIQMGEGLGSGNDPKRGYKAAMDSIDKIREELSNGTRMVFITAGMGGGTGTGATPVIARIARELGILTVAIVTIPFRYEGTIRLNQALEGINRLKEHVDSLLIIDNEKLYEMYSDLKLSEAFAKADNILTMAARGIAEIITLPGVINVDFADVRTIMTAGGVTMMGSAAASGENRARKAIDAALNSPLLNNNDVAGARRILLNITSGSGKNEVVMDEIKEITDYLTHLAKPELMIWGAGIDDNLHDAVNVTIVATDFVDHGWFRCELPAKDPADVYIMIDPAIDLTDTETSPSDANHYLSGKYPSSESSQFEVREKPISSSTGNKNKKPYASATARSATDRQAQPSVMNLHANIEEIENTPAYIRKKVKLDNQLNN